ncbi:MAG: cellulose biosynthesis cyclic di-GMP-binding regulatory protein BcsB [Nitrospirota bacterium]|nr:cellulose biosynthesis cyclic di-GMP-binding regulatory protein BcsB [Nitrospirota bacterium]
MKKLIIATIAAWCLAAPAQAEVYKVPLTKLAPVTSVDLRCTQGQYEIAVPVPERWNVTKAVLTLDYANSASMMGDRSHLLVTMNGKPLGQIRLDRKTPSGRKQLNIAPQILHPGYNMMNIVAVQHYAAECEQVCAPNLWTTVNLYDSSLELTYDLKPVPMRLSTLSDFLFDPRVMPQGSVHMITAGLASDTATMTAIAAAGIARKFDYRKVLFTASRELQPGVDNVLIANKAYAESFLQQRGMNISVKGPYLKILPLPLLSGGYDPGHALLVVSGNTPEEIKLASETLAHVSLPFPGSSEMTVRDFKLPDISQYGGRQILATEKVYTLKMLNFSSHTFSGFNPNPRHISFRLPADFLVKPNQYAKLNLNFAYGAGMRVDSVMNVVVNDRSVRVIHLENQDGESVEGYRIDLPTYLFKPGYNTIRFEPTLNPVAQECDILRPEGFFLTIFENSTFQFPRMPHFVEMPKLELFMLDGFPVTRWPDGYEAVIFASRKDFDTLSAALNLVGLISQKNGYPLFGITVSFERPERWKGEMIVLGDVATIPEDLLNLAPLKLATAKNVPYPVVRNWESESTFAFSGQTSTPGPDQGIVMQFQSPVQTGRSVVMLTGAGVTEVAALSRALLDPVVQDRVRGDLVLINLKDPSQTMNAVTAGPAYYTGTSGTLFKLEYFFYKYKYVNYILLSLAIVLFGGIIYIWLKKRRKQRMGGGDATPGH